MKQIDSKKLCYYCLGCEKLSCESFTGVMRCESFMPGIENWQEKRKQKMKNDNRDTFNV